LYDVTCSITNGKNRYCSNGKPNCDSYDLCLCHRNTCVSLRKRLKQSRYVAYADCSCYCGYFTFVNVHSIFTSSYLHVPYQSRNIVLEFWVCVKCSWSWQVVSLYQCDEMRYASCLVKNNRHWYPFIIDFMVSDNFNRVPKKLW
jgi:hypothetical protein